MYNVNVLSQIKFGVERFVAVPTLVLMTDGVFVLRLRKSYFNGSLLLLRLLLGLLLGLLVIGTLLLRGRLLLWLRLRLRLRWILCLRLGLCLLN